MELVSIWRASIFEYYLGWKWELTSFSADEVPLVFVWTGVCLECTAFFSVFRVNYFCLLLCLHKRCATNWDLSIFRKSTASEMVSHRIEKPHRKKRKMTGLNENCIEWTQFMAMHKQPHSTTNQPPYITYYIVLFRKAGDANITHIKIDSTLITSMF